MSRYRVPAALAAALLLPAAAPADLLVTRDGATVETRGPWRVDGRRVVFTQPNGTLSSLAAAEVDLDQSTLATARAAEEAARAAEEPAAPAPLGEPVLRITEEDIPPMSGLDEDGEPTEGAAATTTPAGNVPLEVVSWDKLTIGDGDGVAVFGTLRNTGSETVIAPTLSVSVYGEEGGLLALDDAEINLGAIPTGKTANFRAEFPGLPDFAAVRFIPAGRGYEGRPPAGGVEGEEAAGEAGYEEESELPAEESEAPPPAD